MVIVYNSVIFIIKKEFQSLKKELLDDFTNLHKFLKSLSTKEGWSNPDNSNKVSYVLSTLMLFTSFVFFIFIHRIPIEVILAIYNFSVDVFPFFFIFYALLSVYMFTSRPKVGKGMVALVLSAGFIQFLFVHIYADKYSLDDFATKYNVEKKIKEKKKRTWTYDVNWRIG